VVAALEFWGGARSGSLALLTDAVHVCMDLFALAIALVATIGASRPADARRTFGYGRIEMLGALANGALLLGATIFIVYQAVERFYHPSVPAGSLMAAVAAIGLAINVGVGLLLLRDGKHNLNVAAALFHVAGDAFGAVAVIAGGIVIAVTHAAWIDPMLSLVVAAVIVIGVVRVLRDATDVLLEAVPRGIDTDAVVRDMGAVPGVVAVHDLHVWTIGSDAHALSAHVQLDDRRISEATAVLRTIVDRMREHYGIAHATLQFECESCEPDGKIICTQIGSYRPGR
jgi:cobalt-zinc-cadmium efflux system protein